LLRAPEQGFDFLFQALARFVFGELVLMARDTKLGAEEITRDIPNLAEQQINRLDEAEEITRDIPNLAEQQINRLDESGIIYVGAEVVPGDVLVGKERGLFATLSLFTRSPVIVTLYDRGESLLAAGEEFQ